MMRNNISVAIAASIGPIVFAAGMAFGQGAERTLRDGVYSEARATRGKAVYDAQCANCHDGGSMGPSLKGDDFLATWENKTLRALHGRILETMPADAPGTLQPQELLDLMAYLVRANGFAPGPAGFETADDLDTIKIVRSR